MSIISKLKLSDQTRAKAITDPTAKKREKLILNLERQIQAAEAADKGEFATFPALRYVTHPETGLRTRQSVRQRIRPWWWQDGAGKVFTCIKYGNKKLELAKGKPAIEIGDKKQLVPVLTKLIEAVKAGELDDALTAVARFGSQKG